MSEIQDLVRYGVDNTYLEEYNLKTVSVGYETDEEEVRSTGYKFIVHRTGEQDSIIGCVGKDFQLVPNDRLKTMADTAAANLGLKPISDISDTFKSHDIRTGKGEHQMALLYGLDEPFAVGELEDGSPDNLTFTVAVYGSEDGSWSTHVGGGSFRIFCSNQALTFLAKDLRFKTRRHTKGYIPSVAQIQADIHLVIDNLEKVKTAYEAWFNREVTQDDVKSFQEINIPKIYMPAWLKPEKPEDKIKIPKAETWWKVYNDFTYVLTRAETREDTKKALQRELHKVFVIA